MTAEPHPVSNLPPPSESPFQLRHLLDLLFRPGRFFSARLVLDRGVYVVLVTICYSVARAINRIDTQITRSELSARRNAWSEIVALLEGSWLYFWGIVLVAGLIGALFLWWIGGWWYGLRIRWSDVPDLDWHEARLVYVYSALIESVPIILAALIQTFVYSSFMEAYRSDQPYSLLLIVFPFWSVVVSCVGVTTRFPVTRWKARLWFLILPILLYGVGIASLVVALVMA